MDKKLKLPKKSQIKAIRLADKKERIFDTMKEAAKACNVTEDYVSKSLMDDNHISNRPESWSPRTSRGYITQTPKPAYRFEVVMPTEFTLIPNFNGILSIIFMRTNMNTPHIPVMIKRGFYETPSEAYFVDDVVVGPYDFPSAYAAYQFLGVSKRTWYRCFGGTDETPEIKDFFGNSWTIVPHRIINHAKGMEIRGE